MPSVLGVESTVHSTRVELRDAETGKLFGAGRAGHLTANALRTEQDPGVWWNALVDARREAGGALGVSVVAVAAQTHGLVLVDRQGEVIRPAKLRADTEATREATALIDMLGGVDQWVRASGSVPTASSSVARLAWMKRNESESYERTAMIMTPHDWLTFRLSHNHVTDRGDASTTGFFSPRDNQWDTELLGLVDEAKSWDRCLPRVVEPTEPAGDRQGVVIAGGTGDSMAAALGLALGPRDVVISLDPPSVFTVRDRPTEDLSGRVAGYADATGRYLPLVIPNPAIDMRPTIARLLGIDQNTFDRLALEEPPGAHGVTLAPTAGTRASFTLTGLRDDVTPGTLARASVEGVAHALLDDVDALRQADVPVGGRLLLTGTRSHSLPQVLADLAGRPVSVPTGDRVVAGACVQAAALAMASAPDDVAVAWGLDRARELDPTPGVDSTGLRSDYRALMRT